MGQRALRVLHIVPSFTVGGAGRTLISVANRTQAFGVYDHTVLPLEPRYCDPAAVEQASKAGIRTIVCHSEAERTQAITDADIVQVEWWQHPTMERFLTEALPACRLILWSHMVGTVVPHVLRAELQERCDAVVASASVSLHDPLFQTREQTKTAPSTLRTFIPGCYDSNRIRSLPIPDYKVVVGGGDRQLSLKRQAEAFGQAQRFDFRGFVEDIDAFFRELDVFGYPLTPDTSAASELVRQEAMWASFPSVVFPYGGVRDVVHHDWNGLVVEFLVMFDRPDTAKNDAHVLIPMRQMRTLLETWAITSVAPASVITTARECLRALGVPEPDEGWDRWEPPREESS